MRLSGDYLGIATLKFAEIIRVLIVNLTPITNGSSASGVPSRLAVVNYGWLLITLYCMVKLLGSNFGNIFGGHPATSEIAAKVARHRHLQDQVVLSFCLSAFFAGVGGALLSNLLTTIDPKMFTFLRDLQRARRSSWPAASVPSQAASSAARSSPSCSNGCAPWKTPSPSSGFAIPGIPGMRMVVFSLVLLCIICTDARGHHGNA